MVMDLALMREERFGPRVREFAQNPGRKLVYADQDAMNVLFTDRWTAIDPAWNCTTSILLPFVADASWAEDRNHDAFALERAARSPAIVHFDGAPIMRPWHRRCFNPFADLYRFYRASTPWPLLELQGRRRDALFSRIPPRLQAKLWHLRHRGQRL
jgi:lipopolysaccharide biosynthesis glycosyltransferase